MNKNANQINSRNIKKWCNHFYKIQTHLFCVYNLIFLICVAFVISLKYLHHASEAEWTDETKHGWIQAVEFGLKHHMKAQPGIIESFSKLQALFFFVFCFRSRDVIKPLMHMSAMAQNPGLFLFRTRLKIWIQDDGWCLTAIAGAKRSHDRAGRWRWLSLVSHRRRHAIIWWGWEWPLTGMQCRGRSWPTAVKHQLLTASCHHVMGVKVAKSSWCLGCEASDFDRTLK